MADTNNYSMWILVHQVFIRLFTETLFLFFLLVGRFK